MSKAIPISEPIIIAEKHFQGGYSCAQTVLAAFAARYGLSEKDAHSIAAGFGGGLGRSGQVCGAVSGALMVLGLHYWDDAAEVSATKERIYQLSAELMNRFAVQHGSTQCHDLTGVNLRNPVELEQARVDGLFDTLCPGFIRGAIQLLEEFTHPAEGV